MSEISVQITLSLWGNQFIVIIALGFQIQTKCIGNIIDAT